MDFESVKTWLTNYNNKQIGRRWMLAWLGFILLPIATMVGGLLIYGFLWLILHQSERNAPGFDTTCLWITLAIVLVAFIATLFFQKQKEPETFYHEDAQVEDSLVGHYVNRRKVQAKFFLWIILTGPRLLGWSISSLNEISRLKKQDVHSCAAVMWLSIVKRGKVPYDDLPKELDWLEVEPTLLQLKHIPGILFLKTPPAGISLSDDLRKAIRTGALEID